MKRSLMSDAALSLCIIAAVLLLSSFASAATISGYVYDLSFEEVDNAVVEIDTEPHQVKVTKDGLYRFSVPPGQYTIRASKGDLSVEENITVSRDGNFTRDLILFPSFEEEKLEDDLDQDLFEDALIPQEEHRSYMWYILLLGIIALGNLAFVFRRRIRRAFNRSFKGGDALSDAFVQPSSASDDLRSKVLAYLDDQHGRSTQKEIRRQFPFSEAKISLVISELENEGIIKKFKRGRSNVIVLRKK